MPFTLSHIAAALPFARTGLYPTAVAIGTMVPDVFYYLPVRLPRGFTHSWLGVVTIDLLVGVLLFALWQGFLRVPVVELMPRFARARIGRSTWTPGIRSLALVAASVLIGTATHVIWDLFTHDGSFVTNSGPLATVIGPQPVYKWLQYASSVLGLVAISIFVAVWARRVPEARELREDAAASTISSPLRVAWWAVVLVSGFVAAFVPWVLAIIKGTSPIDNGLVFFVVCLGLAVAGAAGFVACVAVAYRLRSTATTLPSTSA